MRTLHWSSLLLASVHVLTAASPARAQPAPPATAPAGDVVHLKNGGQIRGTIVDVIPGSHARIQLATGEVTTIPWDEVARVESGRPPPAATTTMPAPAAPVAALPHKIVHIDAPRAVTLERRAPDSKAWVEVCSAPCDRDVVSSGSFRVAGSGVRASAPFTIETTGGDRVYIVVDPGSKGWFVGGIVITSLGGATAIVGLALVLVGSATHDMTGTSGSGDSLTSIGLGVAGIGALATALGLVALVSNVHSSASLSPLPPTQTEATTRRPIWQEAAPTRPLIPPASTSPVFTVSF